MKLAVAAPDHEGSAIEGQHRGWVKQAISETKYKKPNMIVVSALFFRNGAWLLKDEALILGPPCGVNV